MRANMLDVVLFDDWELLAKSIDVELEHAILICNIRAFVLQLLNCSQIVSVFALQIF